MITGKSLRRSCGGGSRNGAPLHYKMKNRRTFVLDNERIRENCLRCIREDVPLPDGKKRKRPFRVIIEPDIADKSAEQRGGFHFLCDFLGQATGYSREEVKDLVVREILGTKQIKIGGRVQEVRMSSESNDGEAVDVIEYNTLIDGIYRIGGEAGIVLPILDKFRRERAA